MRDTAHVYGQLAPLGQLKAGRLDFNVASASPSARAGGSPWAGMSGAAVIADNHLAGVITVDLARYAGRLVAVPASGLLADEGFRTRLAAFEVRAQVAAVGAGWYLRLPGEQAVSLAPAYRPGSRGSARRCLRCCARNMGWCRSWAASRCWTVSPAGARIWPPASRCCW